MPAQGVQVERVERLPVSQAPPTGALQTQARPRAQEGTLQAQEGASPRAEKVEQEPQGEGLKLNGQTFTFFLWSFFVDRADWTVGPEVFRRNRRPFAPSPFRASTKRAARSGIP